MTVTISLGHDRKTIIDEVDAHFANQRWGIKEGYAAREKMSAGKRRVILLHREILGVDDPKIEVDHINTDRLDNRRGNLRVTSRAQNSQNRARGYGASRYRGVDWRRSSERWRASAKLDGKQVHLGHFVDELLAARAAEAYRRKHMPYAVENHALDPVPPCPCRPCRDGRLTEGGSQ